MHLHQSIFHGTAEYYAKYRPSIPTSVVDYVKQKCHLDGTGLLLDIGCGTGISTRAFAPLFAKTIAFDVDPEMLSVAIAEGAPRTEWSLCSDEDLDLGNETVKVALAVRSFHWLNQNQFLQRLKRNMVEGSAVAIIGDGSFWTGQATWQKKTKEVIQSYLGATRQAGKENTFSAPQEPYEAILKKNGFADISQERIPVVRHWNLESIIGYLYSTSFSSYDLYNGQNAKFEQSLRAALLKSNNGNPDFVEEAVFTIQIGVLSPTSGRLGNTEIS